MFFKKKRFYSLSDIRKQIVYSPLIFVSILCIISSLIAYFFFSVDYKNKLDLLAQKESFARDNLLRNYIKNIKYVASSNLDIKEISLRDSVFEVKGYINSFSNKEKLDILKLKKYIAKLEKKLNISFLVFDNKNYEVLYGHNLLKYLNNKTNTKIDSKQFNYHMLKNIEYTGDDNIVYWFGAKKIDVRISYFRELKERKLFLGSFSLVDDMKLLTKKAIINSISNKNNINNKYFIFYDKKMNLIYNLDGKGLHKTPNEFDKNKLKKYESYTFPKYGYEIFHKNINMKKQKKEMKKEYELKLIVSISLIFLFGLFLIAVANIFGRFISQIFNRYNSRSEMKNTLLRKWKERYELAIIASNDGLWELNLDTNKIFFSNKWLEMFGYQAENMRTFKDWISLVHKDDKENVLRSFQNHISTKNNHFICEYRLKDNYGNFRWVLVRGKAFYSKHKNRMLMMSMDIDRRIRLADELRNVEQLTDFGRIVIFRWKNDEELKVEFVSKSVHSYGYTVDDFESSKIKYFDFIYKDDIPKIKKIINKTILEDSNSFTKIHRVIDKKNNIRWVYNRTILIKDDYGKVKYLYGYLNDITKIKLNEEELKQKIKLEVEKNIQKDRILIQQNKMASMGEMLGNIAHQWRQPLNNISLLIYFIRDNYGNFSKDELNDVIQSAKVQCDYMSQTIDDFRNFYQPSKDKQEFNVKKAISQCSKIVQTYFEKNSVKLDILGDEVIINNFKNEFEQVIVNILNNAVDAAVLKNTKSKFDAKVNISVKKEGENILIIISNNCGNIKEEYLTRIFEPYFTTKFESQGTGIGLYMSKVIIENNMNGKIEAFNENDGVKFIIRLFN